MSRRIRRFIPPEDVEVYCLAIANPGVFYGRNQDGDIVSGETLELAITWGADPTCGGDENENPPDKSVFGYVALAAGERVQAELSGDAIPFMDPDFGDRGQGTQAFIGGGSLECDAIATDCCDVCTSFTGPYLSDPASGPCCALAFGAELLAGVACVDGGGRPALDVTLTFTIVPEA
jgi:hypothetical protein